MGDKICEWIAGKFPVMCRIVGGMSEWQLVGFGLLLLLGIFAVYTAAWNVWLCLVEAWRCGPSGRPVPTRRGLLAWDEDEPYEAWMDAEIWESGR